MSNARIAVFLIGLSLTFGGAMVVAGQEVPSQQPPTEEEQQKEKESSEKKAVTLLEQIVDEAQSLKLPENRIRVQIAAGDLLWPRNEKRARSLFSLAADGVAEVIRNTDNTGRQRTSAQLRQDLVITVAQHDVTLAYQLLAATRQLTPPGETANSRGPDADANLEQNLLAEVAALDPKLALQNAEALLEKGQYPNTLVKVLAELQVKDKDAAAKLSDKVLQRLQSKNMLTSADAGNLALGLLRPGPRPASTSTGGGPAASRQSASTQGASNNAATPVLSQSAFHDLMESVIEAALKATPQPRNNNQRNFRGGQINTQSPPTDEQIEQNNARRLLFGLQALLPQIDQYAPSRTQAVQQKMTEIGVGNNPRLAFNQLNNLMEQGTADSLLAAAPTAPPAIQSRIYQQAALKALDEGNADRARQIANDHLDSTARDAVLQKVDFQQMSRTVEANKLEEVRQTLSRLHSDDERINLLLQLADATQKNDAKLAARFLGEAQRLTNRRATSYQQFDEQLKVAHAFGALEPARSFEVLEPGISQLNELLSAAALLSGFEVNIFRDGELPLLGGSKLTNVVTRYARELGVLAKSNFERAQAATDRFQLAEPRILARLSIVRGVLDGQPTPFIDTGSTGRGFGINGQFMRGPQ